MTASPDKCEGDRPDPDDRDERDDDLREVPAGAATLRCGPPSRELTRRER